MEVTVLCADGAGSFEAPGTVRQISLRAHRRGRYRSLAAALALLDPDVVHLQAEPDSAVACQVADLCGIRSGRAFVLETEGGLSSHRFAAAWRARRSLAQADAAVARSSEALAGLRRSGFRGQGVIASPGEEPHPLPERADARRALRLPHAAAPVFGWAGTLDDRSGPLGDRSGITDALEAIAASESEVILVIAEDGPERTDVLDRADALEILHRVRFVPPERAGASGIAAFPDMLGAIDALLLAPTCAGAGRPGHWRAIALAQTLGIPVVYADLPGFAEAAGPGSWPIPAEDPTLLARLLDELAADPTLLAAAAAAAASHAAQHHTPQAVAAKLAFAIRAAHLGRRQVSLRDEPAPTRDYLPSRT